jgi:ADP-ribose pyrophosphatase YjhB (NUDIX family)
MAFEKLSPEVLRQHKGISFTGITTVFYCHDGYGKLFLTKRSKNTRDEHGRWDPGGGGLKHGQSIEESLRREVLEEYNVVPIESEFIGYYDVFRETPQGLPTHWLAMCFAVKVDPDQVKINEPEMVDDFGWFTLGNLPSPMHSQFNHIYSKFGDKLRDIMAA